MMPREEERGIIRRRQSQEAEARYHSHHSPVERTSQRPTMHLRSNSDVGRISPFYGDNEQPDTHDRDRNRKLRDHEQDRFMGQDRESHRDRDRDREYGQARDSDREESGRGGLKENERDRDDSRDGRLGESSIARTNQRDPRLRSRSGEEGRDTQEDGTGDTSGPSDDPKDLLISSLRSALKKTTSECEKWQKLFPSVKQGVLLSSGSSGTTKDEALSQSTVTYRISTPYILIAVPTPSLLRLLLTILSENFPF